MFLQDLRYAIRTLVKNRGVTAIAVICLSLGIGTNAAIFSVVDGVILKPEPYPDAEHIVVLRSVNHRLHVSRGGLSFQDFSDLRESSTTLSTMAAFTMRSLTIADGAGDPERYSGAAISSSLFDILGTNPVLGRNFTADDDRPGAEPVVLLSDEVWRRRYAADPQFVGRAISVNGRSTTIVGVMPPRFAFPETQRLWVPLSLYSNAMLRQERELGVFAKLRPGTTRREAESDVAGIATRLAAAYPRENEDWSARVTDLREWLLPGPVKLMILTMMGAVTLVLLIACANVANLLLARASVRHREISIRTALGASRWRIVRQLLTEAIGIGLLSAPLGILLAWIGVRLLDRAMPVDAVPYFIHWSVDARSLAYTIGIAMLTGIVFGLAPALQAVRTNLQDSLKEGGRGGAGGRRARARNALVVVEVALSLVLLAGASMFMHSFMNLQASALGYDTKPLMTMRFFMPGVQYDTQEAKAQRVEDIVRRIESLPGVQAAFASNFVPLGGGGDAGGVIAEGKPVEKGKEPAISFVAATPHLRQTMNIALVRGRDLTASEELSRTPIALINQAMARRVWGDVDPIGRRFRLADPRQGDWFTVVGIVADFRHDDPNRDQPVSPAAYVPYSLDPTINTGLTIRMAGDPASITSAARNAIRSSDAGLPVFAVSTLEELRQLGYWQDRLFGIMFSIFGAIALVLAAVGVYGMLSYSVSQRTQEIGVRMALGAARSDVMRLVVGHGLKLTAIGVAIGIGGAVAAAMQIRSVLFNVKPTDPISLIGVALFLAMTAVVASYFPARRAMAVDPLIALRNE
jgi:putative ABC transport system permease protein